MGRYRRIYDYGRNPNLRQAVQFVLNGETYQKACRITGIAHSTIKKHYMKYTQSLSKGEKETILENITKNIEFEVVFTQDQMKSLIEWYKYFESLFYGLSEKECRMLAYQMVVREDLKIPHDWTQGMASAEWLMIFKQRHFNLQLVKPHRCTGAKNIVWEKANVTKFYENLERIINENSIFKDGTRIFSLDETYLSIDPRQMRLNREAKRDLLTACFILNACGTALPPVIIRPHNSLDYGEFSEITPDTLTLTASRGRLTCDLFPNVMQHFITHSNSSLENPSILIMDTDLCHLSIDAFHMAKICGVQLITLHPHISKQLQPLEVGIFSLFHKHYNAGIESWINECKSVVAELIVPLDIGKIVSESYKKTMKPENIQNAFKSCGILPFDRDLFTDSDCLSWLITEKPCYECRSRNDKGRKLIERKPVNVVSDEEETYETLRDPPLMEVSAEAINCADYNLNETEYQIPQSDGKSSPSDSNEADASEAHEDTPKNEGHGNEKKRRLAESSETGEASVFHEKEMSQRQKKTELDRLKRRMIRTVARLLKEKKSEEEVWEELRKESGSNCKKLWDRMRSLTMKKLNRLLDAHDRIELVPSVARMTLTDWLLYDLVIVHEKIDVIDRKRLRDSKVLDDLFALVQRFMIEGRSGDDLAEAWTAATINYNSKGHQCSPMLMQRRWYQLKELTRDKLYKFWFTYRGNERLLASAKQDPPTELQKAIALRYPDIITKPFPDWEERIEKKLVIMPEEFEVKMRKKPRATPNDESAPDVVIVERKIDTITLRDSDSEYYTDENSWESNAVSQNMDINIENDETSHTSNIIQVKTEPEDDSIDIIDHFPYQPQPEEPKDRFEEEIERLMIEEDKILTHHVDTTEVETSQIENESEDCVMPLITEVKGAVDTDTEYTEKYAITSNENLENMDNNLKKTVDIEKAVAIENDTLVDEKELRIVENNFSVSVNTETVKTIQDNNQIDDRKLEIAGNNFDERSQESILIDHDDEMIPLKCEAQEESNDQVVINKDFDISNPEVKITKDIETNRNDSISAENHFSITATANSSHIEVKMDIDTVFSPNEEENVNEVIPHVPQNTKYFPTGENTLKAEHDRDSYSLDQTVYLNDEVISEINFADDGIEFADDGIEYFDNEYQNELCEMSGVVENHADEINGTPKFDLKLLMNPVVYTKKLDEMSVYQDRPLFDTINDKELIDNIIFESKPISTKSINVDKVEAGNSSAKEVNDTVQVKVEYQENQDTNEVDDDLFHNDSSDESDDDVIDESKKVKLSSNLLQKPKSRSYNPIQLCKNPDFNTRLKRLTVGFFSSSRNRVFLKACKPMTVDLSKAFESKLIDGTLYLKPSDQTIKREVENIPESTAVSILPSAVAVQSLMDTHTSDVDIILQEELKRRMLERKKIINLPNISVVRQMNQQLLMVEVAPIMAQVDKCATAQIENDHQNVIAGENKTFLNEVENTEYTNNSNSYNSALKVRDEFHNNIETHTNSNDTKKSTNETFTNASLPLPVADSSNNNKTKADKALEKLKRRQEKLKNMNIPSWLSKSTPSDVNSESLLTLDTLYKMLNALDPRVIQPLPTKQIKKKNRLNNAPVKKSCISVLNDEVNVTNKLDKQQEATSVLGSDDTSKNKKRACCWAKSKIDKINCVLPCVRLNKHRCPEGNCKCCCKELLRQMQIDFEVKILENMQKYSDRIDNVTKVIDHVAKQSQSSTNVIEPPSVQLVNADPNAVGTSFESLNTMSVDVGLQADMDDYDSVQIINNAAEITVKETNTEPEVPAAEKELEVTIDLVEDEVNVTAVSKKQSPKPKIRVYTGNVPLKKTIKKAPSVKPNIRPRQAKPRSVMPKQSVPVTMPFTSKLKSKEAEDEPDSVPCLCRLNVAVEQSSAMLIIDGSSVTVSNDCLRHTKSRVSKETRIYLNRKHMSATERPFYVGKNKILLTNIKQIKPQPPPPEPLPMALPDGTQVVMLPDGTITYIVHPTVELTPEQIAAMPVILSAIQAQIKAAGITLPILPPVSNEVCETINLEDEVVPEPVNTIDDVQNLNTSKVEDEKNKENSNSVSEKVLPTESLNSEQNGNDDISTNSITGQLDLQNVVNQETSSNESAKTVSHVVDNTNNISDNTLSTKLTSDNKEYIATNSIETEAPACLTEPVPTTNEKENDIAENEHNYAQESPDKNGTIASSQTVESNKTAANASRNLLSDLMEMSGILEEDIAPIQQEPIIKENSITSPKSIIQPIMLEIPELTLPQPGLIPVPELSPFDKRKHSISAQINEKIHELNPITSFAELKYSCENDGLFFKLDLSNGVIVPINVCIQKNSPEPANLRTNRNPVEVIDLTNEEGVSINEEDKPPTTTENVKHSFTITPRKTSTMMSVIRSPDKQSILKINSATSVKLSAIEQKKQALLNKLSNNLKPLKILQRQKQNINILRKSLPTSRTLCPSERINNLSKADVKINLVDSDAPMEEEYLVDDSSDDSDDEPLAKVAKKMRLADQKSEHGPPNEKEPQGESVSQEKSRAGLLHSIENIDFEEAIDAIEPPELLRASISNDNEPVPTQLVLTGGAVNQPIPLNQSFLSSNEMESEDSQDDCILGV